MQRTLLSGRATQPPILNGHARNFAGYNAQASGLGLLYDEKYAKPSESVTQLP